MKEDEEGWIAIKQKAFDLVSEIGLLLTTKDGNMFFGQLKHTITDFFADEMSCLYGFEKEIFQRNQNQLRKWLEDNTLEKREKAKREPHLKLYPLYQIMIAAYWSILPPSYPEKGDEKKLEEMVLGRIVEISAEDDYQKIKSTLKKLKVPPRENNIYECVAEIIELAQDFIEKNH